uniref:Recombinase RecA n=1 Tax=Archaeoglobus fulgidus TaxID=2234 RepID=A0A7J2TKP3_ARCFL
MLNVEKLLLRKGISTGISLLDKRLDGGLPAGSFVCLYADPIAMPEVFLYHLASSMKSYYITTNRPAKYVTRDMEMLNFSTKNVLFIDAFSQYFLNEYGQFVVEDRYRDKEIFDFLADMFQSLNGEEDFVLILDSLSFFLNLQVEWGLKEWLLNRLYSIAKEKKTLVCAYMIKKMHPESVVYRVIDLSDVVINVEAERIGEKFVMKFAIPKIRGKRPITEFFRFTVDEGIQIDTSRDIA